jgi:HAD superfamily hydrolase (TIGR01509 family)
MTDKPPIKAIIFDLNGIFLQSPKLSDRMEADFGVKKEEFVPKLQEIMVEIRKPGAKPAFTYWAPFLKKLKLNLNESSFWDYWFKNEIVSEVMFDIAKDLRAKGIKVLILSNNFRERAFHHKRYNLIEDSFDAVYYSWQTGYIKPDPRAWQKVLKDQNLKAEECLYFDDQQRNVDASNKAGIKAFLFTTEPELEKILKEHI